MHARMAGVKAPEETRRRILEHAFLEFYRQGFQGGSINRIVESTATTKGALFHHFPTKNALGHAVVDDVVRPLLLARWLEPLENTRDPIADLQRIFASLIDCDIASGNYVYGCPLNNLAQEVAPLDPEFRTRIDAAYEYWRIKVAEALTRGIELGKVRPKLDVRSAAAFIVASQTGIWGAGKSSQNPATMREAAAGFAAYLDSLRQ